MEPHLTTDVCVSPAEPNPNLYLQNYELTWWLIKATKFGGALLCSKCQLM